MTLRASSCAHWIAALAAVSLAAGCGSSDDWVDDGAPGKTTVVLGDGAYHPVHARLTAGDRITFVNRGSRLNTAETGGAPLFAYDRESLHRRGRFDTHVLDPGEAETIRLSRPGTYDFHSSLDRDMVGTLEVVGR